MTPFIKFFTPLLLFSALLSPPAFAEKVVEYKDGDTVLEGFLVEPKTVTKNTPAVVVVHEWMGLGDYAKMRARMLADLGYIAFAADIYGKGIRPANADEAGKLAAKYRSDRPLMRKRILSAIATTAKLPNVDAKRIAVMGYCFGGTVALEAARAHAPIIAAISFHGGLASPTAKETKDLTAKIIAFHGGDDPTVPAEEVKAFQDEMRNAKADWQFISYGGAVHAFTQAQIPYKPGAAFGYNEAADRRSWTALKTFLTETFRK